MLDEKMMRPSLFFGTTVIPLALLMVLASTTAAFQTSTLFFLSEKPGASSFFFRAKSSKNNEDGETSRILRSRVSIAGVTVSSTGFWVVMRTKSSSSKLSHQFLPIRVTDDIMDQTVATSPEALTMLQLMANVDLAGMILPPNLLDQVVAVYCQEEEGATGKNHDDVRKNVAEAAESAVKKVWNSVNKNDGGVGAESFQYSDQNDWIRSRVRLPSCSLNEVIITDDNCYELQVKVADYGSTTVRLEDAVLQEVCYQYRPAVSAAFLAIALALRYKAPITVIDNSRELSWYDDEEVLLRRFPNYRAAAEILEPADRSAVNIKRGFEIHKLQSALKVARDKGDDAAAAKIRAAIDELDADSFQDVPVQPESDTGSME